MVIMMFATRLKKLRFEKDITQAEFAKVIGVSQQTVASWEVGRTEPANEALKNIADYFNVSTDYLLGREDTSKNISLSDEQKNLLKDFDGLNEEGRTTLCTVLNALLATHSARNMPTLT